MNKEVLIRHIAELLAEKMILGENPTNGDVIISMYPNLRYTIHGNRIVTTIGVASSFDLDWWNAPYEGGNSNG